MNLKIFNQIKSKKKNESVIVAIHKNYRTRINGPCEIFNAQKKIIYIEITHLSRYKFASFISEPAHDIIKHRIKSFILFQKKKKKKKKNPKKKFILFKKKKKKKNKKFTKFIQQ